MREIIARQRRLQDCPFYDLGFKLDTTALQDTLDFGSREKELFKGKEMGEDAVGLSPHVIRHPTGCIDRDLGDQECVELGLEGP